MSSRLLDTVTLGRRRRRRRMNELMRELDRLDRATSLRTFDLRQQKTQQKTHRVGSLLVALLLLAGAGGVVYVATRHHSSHRLNAATQSDLAAAEAAHLAGDTPTPGIGEKKSRILPAPQHPAGSGGYKLFGPASGPPLTYDPCRPIHYVIRDQNTPPGGDLLVAQAVAAVSKATGLQFIADGDTTEKPTLKRESYQPTRYGDRWAPVLVAWTTPTEVPVLKGPIAGWGGSQSYALTTDDGYAYVSGIVYLDTPQLTKILQKAPHGNVGVRATIEHELGHVVGLNHVTDPTQLMYPKETQQTGYGAGDLRGLATVGSGACHPEL